MLILNKYTWPMAVSFFLCCTLRNVLLYNFLSPDFIYHRMCTTNFIPNQADVSLQVAEYYLLTSSYYQKKKKKKMQLSQVANNGAL